MLNYWRIERRSEMGFVSSVMGFFGFGIGITIGLVIGYYLFIYFQPRDAKVSVSPTLFDLTHFRHFDFLVLIVFHHFVCCLFSSSLIPILFSDLVICLYSKGITQNKKKYAGFFNIHNYFTGLFIYLVLLYCDPKCFKCVVSQAYYV